MTRLISCLLLGATMIVTQGSRGDALQPLAEEAESSNPAQAGLPVGKWKVEFANGVIETCRVGNGGEATVEEPRRGSHGMAALQDGAVVMTFHDDRVERWTPVGKRFVVEHWFPGSQLPTVSPVLGIAERAR